MRNVGAPLRGGILNKVFSFWRFYKMVDVGATCGRPSSSPEPNLKIQTVGNGTAVAVLVARTKPQKANRRATALLLPSSSPEPNPKRQTVG